MSTLLHLRHVALIGFFLLAVISSSASATPEVSLHWSDCTSTVLNRSHTEGTTSLIVVTASGFPGTVRAHQVKVRVGRAYVDGIPDAWRFDGSGCNAGGFAASLQSGGPDCPFLLGQHSTIYSSFEFIDGQGVATFSAVYDPMTANLASTYTIARFVFDHSYGGHCGCFDQPECIHLSLATWLDDSQDEQAFTVGREFLLWNDPANSTSCPSVPLCAGSGCESTPYSCGPTPARSKTWGAIKATYR